MCEEYFSSEKYKSKLAEDTRLCKDVGEELGEFFAKSQFKGTWKIDANIGWGRYIKLINKPNGVELTSQSGDKENFWSNIDERVHKVKVYMDIAYSTKHTSDPDDSSFECVCSSCN